MPTLLPFWVTCPLDSRYRQWKTTCIEPPYMTIKFWILTFWSSEQGEAALVICVWRLHCLMNLAYTGLSVFSFLVKTFWELALFQSTENKNMKPVVFGPIRMSQFMLTHSCHRSLDFYFVLFSCHVFMFI